MPNNRFRISARTILQLGGELISSDGIAFYELIKNAVDAGSPEIAIDVVSRLPFDAIGRVRHLLENTAKSESPTPSIADILQSLVEEVNLDAPGAEDFIAQLQSDVDAENVGTLLDNANYITFCDTGHGMSLADLEEVYMHVGTPTRLLEKRQDTDRRTSGKRALVGCLS